MGSSNVTQADMPFGVGAQVWEAKGSRKVNAALINQNELEVIKVCIVSNRNV